MKLVAVVLAAGQGSRAGGPKALVRTRDGVPLVLAHAAGLIEVGVSRVLLVVREPVARTLADALPRGARLVVSREPDVDGPAGSLRAAFGPLAEEAAALVLVTPVDKRQAPPACVHALVEALSSGAAAARATHAGRGGHPVIVRAFHLAPYGPTGPPRPPPLRDVLRALGPGPTGLVDVACGEEAIDDLDDAEALRRAISDPAG